MIEFTVSRNYARLTAGKNANDTKHRSDVKLSSSLTMLAFPFASLGAVSVGATPNSNCFRVACASSNQDSDANRRHKLLLDRRRHPTQLLWFAVNQDQILFIIEPPGVDSLEQNVLRLLSPRRVTNSVNNATSIHPITNLSFENFTLVRRIRVSDESYLAIKSAFADCRERNLIGPSFAMAILHLEKKDFSKECSARELIRRSDGENVILFIGMPEAVISPERSSRGRDDVRLLDFLFVLHGDRGIFSPSLFQDNLAARAANRRKVHDYRQYRYEQRQPDSPGSDGSRCFLRQSGQCRRTVSRPGKHQFYVYLPSGERRYLHSTGRKPETL